jgi:segregation and condensation protein B
VAELTKTETFALTAIAYLQPVTRGEISRLAGREISRDVIASLKRHGLIDGAIRAPRPGAPFAYVTTKTFLEAFGFASLRDLPDLERLKAEGLLQSGQEGKDFDSALGLADENEDPFESGRKVRYGRGPLKPSRASSFEFLSNLLRVTSCEAISGLI